MPITNPIEIFDETHQRIKVSIGALETTLTSLKLMDEQMTAMKNMWDSINAMNPVNFWSAMAAPWLSDK